MFKSLIDSIKGTRKLSMNHWRYKLLHWSFGIESSDGRAGVLPKFLYTHYCPLFHLTNILLFISPIILFARITAYLCRYLAVPLSYICSGVDYVMSNYKINIIPKRTDKEKELEYIYNKINRYLIRENYDFDCVTPEFILNRVNLSEYKEAEAKDLIAKYLAKVKVRRESKLVEEKQRAEQMVFWINLSRTMLKCVYSCIALLGIYLSVFYVIPFIAWLVWCLFFVNWWEVLYVILGLVTLIAFIAIPISILGYIMVKIEDSNGVIFSSIKYFLLEVFGGLGTFMRECYDFVAVIYENNCPPIEIVSGSDEEALTKLDV